MRDSEFEVWRQPPTTPYRLSSEVLQVPRQALSATLEILRQAGELEMVCFWYGETSVTTVVVPKQQQTWGNYRVSAHAMHEVFRHVSPHRIRNLAQVHSHPGAMVEHSIYDDEMANSRRALSVVVPSYGRWASYWPSGIGVHEFQNDYWHRLGDEDAARRVTLTEGSSVDVIDCR